MFIIVLHFIYAFSIYIDCMLAILMPLFGYPAISAASVFE